LGLVQYRAGQWADAVSSINEAVKLLGRRTGPREYLLLAMSHHQLGDSQKARQFFDQAVAAMKDKPHDPDLLFYRNEAAALLGLDKSDAAQDE
jgi:Flp pilus assembly protein TadD